MLMLSLLPIAAAVARWILKLATRMLARSLQWPEPVVHDTGVFVFVQVQTIETRIAKALCPMRLVRRLRSLLQR